MSWLFRGCGLDFIGEINPASSKNHRFVLVATDYFRKWTKALPIKNMTHKELIGFCSRTHNLMIQHSSDIDHLSMCGIYVTPIQIIYRTT